MERATDVDQLPGASQLPKNEQECFPVDRIESFGKVDENGLKVLLLLVAWICLTEKTMSMVLRPGLKSHCVSGRVSSETVLIRRSSMIRARIFPATDKREIPR